MRLNSAFKIAVIITLLLSGFAARTQSRFMMPEITNLTGLDGGKAAKVTMIDLLDSVEIYAMQYRLKGTDKWLNSTATINKYSFIGEATINNLESEKNYCFRLLRKDTVNQKVEFSNELCSMNLKAILTSGIEVRLEVNGSNNGELISRGILEMDENGKILKEVGLVHYKDSVFYNLLECSKKYRYAIHSIFRDDLDERRDIITPTVFIDPLSFKILPPSIGMSGVSIRENNVKYSIYLTDIQAGVHIQKYNIYRAVNSGDLIKIGESLNGIFEDNKVNTEKNRYTYAFTYENECGMMPPLSGKSSTLLLSTNGSDKLVWTSNPVKYKTNPESEDIIYQVHTSDSLGNAFDMIYKGTDTTFVVDLSKYRTSQRFVVLVKDPSYELNSYSNVITLYPSKAPFIQELVGLNGGKEARLQIRDIFENQKYTIQYRLKGTENWLNSTAGIKRQEIAGEALISGLDAKNNYCFRVIRRDTVNNKETFSNERCSLSLKSTLLSSESVKIEWDKIDTTRLIFYSISVVNGTNDIKEYGYGINDTQAIIQIDCSKKPEFFIRAYYKGLEDYATPFVKSPPIVVDPQSLTILPAPKSLSLVSVWDNKVTYFTNAWEGSPKNYTIYRSANGGGMIKIAESKTNQFVDADVDLEKNNYCYSFSYVDLCGKESQRVGKSCTSDLVWKGATRVSWNPPVIQATEGLFERDKIEYTVEIVNSQGGFNIIGPLSDTTLVIDPTLLLNYEEPPKLRVLNRIYGRLSLDRQMIDYNLSSYSNSLSTEEFKEILFYPNPSDKEIKVYSPDIPIKYIEVIDMAGRKILENDMDFIVPSFPIQFMTIDISTFPKGKYIVRLYGAGKKLMESKTIVKW